MRTTNVRAHRRVSQRGKPHGVRQHGRRVRGGGKPLLTYQEAPAERTAYLYKYQPQAQEKVMMHPQHFLYLTLPPEGTLAESETNKLKRMIRAGQGLDPLFLDVDIDTGQVTAHEGRHRAQAALELGIRQVPVIVYHKRKAAGEDRRYYITEKAERGYVRMTPQCSI